MCDKNNKIETDRKAKNFKSVLGILGTISVLLVYVAPLSVTQIIYH